MLIIFHKDGKLEFPNGIPSDVIFRNFTRISDTILEPKFLPCTFRKNNCKMSPCGKRPVFNWFCRHFGKSVGVNDCKDCHAREDKG